MDKRKAAKRRKSLSKTYRRQKKTDDSSLKRAFGPLSRPKINGKPVGFDLGEYIETYADFDD